MKKKWCGKTVVLLLLLSMCFCMVGCSSMDGSENEAVVAQDNRFTDGRVGQTAEGWLIAEASVDDKSIVINAPITTYPAEEVFSVSLVKDENELMALASELIMSQYTDYQEDMWGWFVERDDRLIVSLGSDNLWTIQLDRTVLGGEVDAANGESSDGLMPCIMLLEEHKTSLGDLQWAARRETQRHLVLTVIEILFLFVFRIHLCH